MFNEESVEQSVSVSTDELRMKIDAVMQEITMFACPGMLPCDYLIFGQLKITLQGRTFHSGKEVQEVKTEWVNNFGGEIWFHAIYNLMRR